MVRIGVSIGRPLITDNLSLTLAPLPSPSCFSTPSDCQHPLEYFMSSWTVPVQTIRATPSHDMTTYTYVIGFLSLSWLFLRPSAG